MTSSVANVADVPSVVVDSGNSTRRDALEATTLAVESGGVKLGASAAKGRQLEGRKRSKAVKAAGVGKGCSRKLS